MISADEIHTRVENYLKGAIALDAFEDWFLSNAWNAHLDSEPSLVDMVHRIEGNLLDLSSGAIGIESFRKELMGAAHLVVPPTALAPLTGAVFAENSSRSTEDRCSETRSGVQSFHEFLSWARNRASNLDPDNLINMPNPGNNADAGINRSVAA